MYAGDCGLLMWSAVSSAAAMGHVCNATGDVGNWKREQLLAVSSGVGACSRCGGVAVLFSAANLEAAAGVGEHVSAYASATRRRLMVKMAKNTFGDARPPLAPTPLRQAHAW